jgi:hypothetical protein
LRAVFRDDSEEILGRDAHNRHRHVLDGDLPADHRGVEPELAFPIRPAQNGDARGGRAIVLGIDQAARRGFQPEQREVVAIDEFAVHSRAERVSGIGLVAMRPASDRLWSRR